MALIAGARLIYLLGVGVFVWLGMPLNEAQGWAEVPFWLIAMAGFMLICVPELIALLLEPFFDWLSGDSNK